MNTKQLVGWVLVVGALNLGIEGVLGTNLVEQVLTPGSILTKAVYVIIGAAGAYKAYLMTSGGKK